MSYFYASDVMRVKFRVRVLELPDDPAACAIDCLGSNEPPGWGVSDVSLEPWEFQEGEMSSRGKSPDYWTTTATFTLLRKDDK